MYGYKNLFRYQNQQKIGGQITPDSPPKLTLKKTKYYEENEETKMVWKVCGKEMSIYLSDAMRHDRIRDVVKDFQKQTFPKPK